MRRVNLQSRRILVLVAVLALLTPTLAWGTVCGGSRASVSTYTVYAVEDPVSVKLRGSTIAEVANVDPAKKSALWVSGRMFGEIPGVGRVVVRISEEQPSFANIFSNDTHGIQFFPAFASQTLYWAFDVIDPKGTVLQTLVNVEPMLISATISQIPPFGTPFLILDDVDFYDQKDLSTPVFTIRGGQSLGILEDLGGLDVRLVDSRQDNKNGTFQTVWEVENVTQVPLDIHWFATGVHGAALDGPSEAYDVTVQPGETLTVPINGFFDAGNLDAGVAFHATSVPDDNVAAEGHRLVRLQQE